MHPTKQMLVVGLAALALLEAARIIASGGVRGATMRERQGYAVVQAEKSYEIAAKEGQIGDKYSGLRNKYAEKYQTAGGPAI
jgi:hypothetical protein